jgi:hypothetical protein
MTLFYSILTAIFVVFVVSSAIYVNRFKAKERALGIRRPELDMESGIAAGTNAMAKGEKRNS